MVNLLFIEDISDYTIYKILDIIRTKEYRKFVDHNPRSRFRGKDSLTQLGCVCSASTIRTVLGSPSPAKISEIIEALYQVGLVYREVLVDTPQHIRRTNGKYAWYTRLEPTDKGKHYIHLYEELLAMCDDFSKLGRLQ